MGCPFLKFRAMREAIATPAVPVGGSKVFGRVIGRRFFAEVVLVGLLFVTSGGWYLSKHLSPTALPTVLAWAGFVIDLLLYFIIHSLVRRRNLSAKMAAAMSEEVRLGAERYRAVVDTAADAIVLADQDGNITSFNRAAEAIFGYAAHEVLGRNVHVLMSEDRAKAHDDFLQRYVDSKAGSVVGLSREVEGRRKDGTLFPLNLSLAAWRSGPREIGFTAIMRDVSEQRAAQRALEKSEHQLQTIMDCATDFAIYQTDLDRRIVKWNKGAERLFGYSGEELNELQIDNLFLDEDIAAGVPERITAQAVMVGREETEGWRLRKDGRIFWASGVVQPIFDGDDIVGLAVILRDMTAQQAAAQLMQLSKKQAEVLALRESVLRGEIEATNHELKSSNESLQKFTSIVAHDLRAPLKRIDAFIDALREDYAGHLDEEGNEMLMRVNRGVARMTIMLDALLDYSRYNAKALIGKTADIAAVITSVIESCDFERFESCINVNAGKLPLLPGDPVLLAHVFQNLIGNAIKFRRGDDLRIDIDVSVGPEQLRVSVTDNGIGIEPRFADRVFEMFCRLHNDDEYEGSGIGLTVCRKIVNDHGGRIWVDKSYDGGTRIVMTLPVAKDDGRLQEAAA